MLLDDKRHVLEALAGVVEITGLEIHVMRASVSCLHLGIAIEREVFLAIEIVADALDRIAGCLMLISVIGSRTAVFGNDDHDLLVGRRHNELLTLFSDRVVARLGTFIEGVAELVVGIADVSLGTSCRASHALAFNKRAGGDINRIVGKRRTVIGLRRTTCGQLDLNRIDLDPTVVYLEGDVGEVITDVLEVGRGETHGDVRLSGIGTLGLGVTVERKVRILVEFGAFDRHVIARNALLGPVVGHGVVMTLNGNRHGIRDRIDRQRALGLLDLIVREFRIALGRIGKAVGRLAGLGLRTAIGVIETFILNEALTCDLNLMLGQRCAVVGLVGVLGLDRHLTLVDNEPFSVFTLN